MRRACVMLWCNVQERRAPAASRQPSRGCDARARTTSCRHAAFPPHLHHLGQPDDQDDTQCSWSSGAWWRGWGLTEIETVDCFWLLLNRADRRTIIAAVLCRQGASKAWGPKHRLPSRQHQPCPHHPSLCRWACLGCCWALPLATAASCLPHARAGRGLASRGMQAWPQRTHHTTAVAPGGCERRAAAWP
jgi:hypothetical protein